MKKALLYQTNNHMSSSKMLDMLREKEQRAITEIKAREKLIVDQHKKASREQLHGWCCEIKQLRSIEIAVRTMIAMIRT